MKSLQHIIPDLKDWEIYKVHKNRDAFVIELEKHTFNKIMAEYPDRLKEVISKTAFSERRRIKRMPWKIDPTRDDQFWKKVNAGIDKCEEGDKETQQKILETVITRYAEEIVGTFKISTFKFARKFLRFFFRRLLNSAAGRNWERIYTGKFNIADRIKVRGDLEKLRKLAQKGTIVLLPTHSSNLDSILVGYAIDALVGLPAFTYGAGLNLYNYGYAAYFMNRLGAYRVDRRKKNPIYLETLKSMSDLAIQKGVNSIFFPGGTRSRDGSIESQLKLGLLGTVFDAQRELISRDKKSKVFIVPLILSYHVVLEAKMLIENFLQSKGKEKYLKKKINYYSVGRILKFAWKSFSKGSDITLSFGKPFDVFGNFVNDEGESIDSNNKPIDIREYFLKDGAIAPDKQRDSEYTKILAEKVATGFLAGNIVLSSHLVAFAAFRILLYKNPKMDLYTVLRTDESKFQILKDELREVCSLLYERLREMEENDMVKLSDTFAEGIDAVIEHGIAKVGVFHVKKPLKKTKSGVLVSEDLKLLYFYHNRLSKYGLEDVVLQKRNFVIR